MRTRAAALAVLAAGLVVVSAVVVHGTTAAPSAVPGPVPALTTDATPVPAGVPTSSLPADAPIDLSLTLSYPHSGALETFLSWVEDPASPLYRHFLSHAQFENDFAPSAASAAQVTATLRAEGGRDVSISPDRLLVSAQLPAAAVDALFGVHLVEFAGGAGARDYTSLGSPTLPADLRGLVDGVTGLSNVANDRLDLELTAGHLAPVKVRPRADQFIINNTTGDQWFIGSDFAQAFGATQLLPGPGSVVNATYPTKVAIATLLASGYNVSGTSVENTPPFDPRVISGYFNDTLASGVPHSNVSGINLTVAGIPSPPPGFSPEMDDSLDEFENSLDLEMAGSLAPGAPLFNFYFAGSLLYSASSDADVAGFFVQDLAAALSYNYSATGVRLGAVTCSFGLPDLNESGWNAELQEAAAMGVTVLAASGDQGNAPDSLTGRGEGQWPLWPASAAFNTSGAVSVGGVSLALGGSPAGWFNGTELNISYDPTAGPLKSVTTWWDTTGGPGNYAGSEGGISTVNPEPDWQLHSAAQPNIVNATVLQGSNALGRAGPDIAFAANSTIAYVYANQSGGIYFTVLGGTSIASPATAGLIADEVAVAHHEFGFIDPEIYRIASYYAANPGPKDPFYDVKNGSNYVFSAGPGWGATDGWGVPLAVLFYQADASPAIANYTYTGPTPGLPKPAPPPPVPWVEIVVIFGVGIAVAVALILVMARPPTNPNAPPPGANQPMPPPPPSSFPTAKYQGATFVCPYCGAIRPAEPVRCPRCGAL